MKASPRRRWRSPIPPAPKRQNSECRRARAIAITTDSSKIGPLTYADVNKVGEAYVKAAPERMLWGSNWPHPNETTKPDDARFLDLLAEWAPSEATRRRILVDNPESLYGFAKAA